MDEDSYLDSYWEDLTDDGYAREEDDFEAYNRREADDYTCEDDEDEPDSGEIEEEDQQGDCIFDWE